LRVIIAYLIYGILQIAWVLSIREHFISRILCSRLHGTMLICNILMRMIRVREGAFYSGRFISRSFRTPNTPHDSELRLQGHMNVGLMFIQMNEDIYIHSNTVCDTSAFCSCWPPPSTKEFSRVHRCLVAYAQVLRFQISRTALALTPNHLAI
jgi:hypothetical protein